VTTGYVHDNRVILETIGATKTQEYIKYACHWVIYSCSTEESMTEEGMAMFTLAVIREAEYGSTSEDDHTESGVCQGVSEGLMTSPLAPTRLDWWLQAEPKAIFSLMIA